MQFGIRKSIANNCLPAALKAVKWSVADQSQYINLPVSRIFSGHAAAWLARIWVAMIFVVVLLQGRVSASQVTLGWTASTDTNIVGYNIYYGTASGVYSTKISLGNATTLTISNLLPGVTYYFNATAVDAAGDESGFSGETVYTVPAPATLTLTPVQTGNVTTALNLTSSGPIPSSWAIESSTDLINWTVMTNGTSASVNVSIPVGTLPKQFFRLVKNNAGNNIAPALATLSMKTVQAGSASSAVNITSTGSVPASWAIQASTDLVNWSSVTNGTSASVNVTIPVGSQPRQFFRLVKN